MNKKYARICWNTEKWARPTGDARLLESDSYVSQNGFGHEEWLFNFDWMLPPFGSGSENLVHYGFTQSLGKFFHKYSGHFLDVHTWI